MRGFSERLGVAFDPRCNVAVDEMSYMISIPKVFSCGDTRRGQSLIVWAIREGRQATHEAWYKPSVAAGNSTSNLVFAGFKTFFGH